MIRLAILQEAADDMQRHFLGHAPFEAGAFCLLRQGRGTDGTRLLLSEVLHDDPEGWELQGEGILRPTARAVSAAVSAAIAKRAGLLFVHSHPHADFPRGLSSIDRSAFASVAHAMAPMLDGPFAAAVVHPDGWSGVLWKEDALVSIDRVVGVGTALRLLSPLPRTEDSPLDSRQRAALGDVQDRLRSLTVAIVGCGGLGSPLAEQMTRMGVGELILVDNDRLDTPSNARRVFGAACSDLLAVEPPPKVDVLARHLVHLGFATSVRRVFGDVRSEESFRALLDADVVINATDTHGSRAVVNDLAATYLLPVIDVGARVGTKPGAGLTALVAEVRVLVPSTACLWCRGSIKGDVIRAENLPHEERRKEVAEGYVVGTSAEPTPSVVALTVLGAGLAACRMLSLLATEGEVASSGYWVDGFMGDAHPTAPDRPISGCRCRSTLGLGDQEPPPFIGN